jgi:hypothetical protein
MKRLAVLAVVACLCGCALAGTGRADSITYDIYSGSTLEAEFVVQSFIDGSTNINPFTPKIIPGGIGSPGSLRGGTLTGPPSEAFFEYNDGHMGPAGTLFVTFTVSQFPTSPGTYTNLDPINTTLRDDMAIPYPTPDKVVITESSSTATPEPASLTLLGIGAVGLLGYGCRLRRRRLPAAAP